MIPQLPYKDILSSAGIFLALAIVFGLIYSQSVLFTSNQNQYFLHGLATAKFGFLEHDWLANTLDPTPVFSFLVNWTYRIFNSGIPFYVYYVLLLAAYLYALIGISRSLFDFRDRYKTLIYLVMLLTIHSAALRVTLASLMGDEWTYLLEGGLAGQRILGEVFQPSSFGIFLIISIYLFLMNYRMMAVIALALAAIMHPTYLLSAGSLVLSFMVLVYQEEKSVKKALQIGIFAFILILPILIYVATSFRSSGPDLASQAQRILVRFRIPHHAQVSDWWNVTAFIQIMIMLIGIWIVRHSRLFTILVIPFALGAVLTIIQIITKIDAIALLFPWRISSILVPLSTSIILAYCVSNIPGKNQTTWEKYHLPIIALSSVVCIFLMVIGTVRFELEQRTAVFAKEHDLFKYLEKSKTSGDIYLVPTKMQEFRLATGAPIFVDFKSIPYQNKEVLEWYRRMQRTIRFYNEERAACGLLADFHRDEGITHVVIETGGKEIDCIFLKERYSDEHYQVFEFTN